jgi:hypothetical protein
MKVTNNSILIPIDVGDVQGNIGTAALKVIKEKDDPVALRVSWGGKAPHGFYFVFRGNLDRIKQLLKKTLDGISELNEEDFRDVSRKS